MQPGAGANDAEHVAEVRAGAHADILEDVDEDLAAFQHAFLQHHQALLQQDDIGGFLGDIHGVIHRDADIGGAQGGGVVDAVAHEPDDVAFALEGLDDALLVRRREAGEHVGGLDGLGQLRVGHGLDLAAEHDLLGIDADLGADLAGDEVVVAGQDLDGHAVLAQGGDGFGGGVLGRVEEGEVAGQDQVGLVGLGIGGLLLDFLGGDGQHAEAVLAEVVDLLDEVADEDGLHREDLAVALEVGAFGEHGLRGALGQQLALAVRALDHDGHHAAGEVEGDFVHLAELIDARVRRAVPCGGARRGRGCS